MYLAQQTAIIIVFIIQCRDDKLTKSISLYVINK